MTEQLNKLSRFLGILLKGYSQVLVCHNSATGLLLAATIFYLSKTIGFLTLVGVLVSTVSAYLIGARTLHIRAGVYGFNGVILGIAGLWFFRYSGIFLVALVLGAFLSSVLMKLLIDLSARTKSNLPALSVPCVLLVWSLVAVVRTFFPGASFVGPDACILRYLQIYHDAAWRPGGQFVLSGFLEIFHGYILAVLAILAAIRIHSRIAGWTALASFLVTLVAVYCLGGIAEFKRLEFYLYNAIPCGVALGGTFLVINRRVFGLALAGVLATAGLTFVGIRTLPLPVFVAPFNLVTIAIVWLVKAGLLARKRGFCAVPMDLISTPEVGLEWHKGELYADQYWQKAADSFKGGSGS